MLRETPKAIQKNMNTITHTHAHKKHIMHHTLCALTHCTLGALKSTLLQDMRMHMHEALGTGSGNLPPVWGRAPQPPFLRFWGPPLDSIRTGYFLGPSVCKRAMVIFATLWQSKHLQGGYGNIYDSLQSKHLHGGCANTYQPLAVHATARGVW